MNASDLAEEAKQTASHAQQVAGELADQVKREASTRLSSQIEHVADGLGGATGALRNLSGELRQQDQSALAGFADQAASKIEGASSYLKGKDLDQIVDDVEQFARRQPAMFIGGAFTVGLLAARLLKSSGSTAGSASSRSTGANGSITSGVGSQPGRPPQPVMATTPVADLYPSDASPRPASVVDASSGNQSTQSPQLPITTNPAPPEFGRPVDEPATHPGTAA